MNQASIEQQLASMGREPFPNQRFQADLEGELMRAHDRRRQKRSLLPLAAGVLVLAGGAYAGAELVNRWRVGTRVDGVAVGDREVLSDEAGRGQFQIPVPASTASGAREFLFEPQDSNALWINFEIVERDGQALVRTHAYERFPIEPDLAIDAFGLAETCTAGATELWGVDLAGPLLFVEPATRFVIANQADKQGRLQERDGVFIGQLPDSEPIANSDTQWAGVHWTMLMWPPPADQEGRARLLAHELFHRVQGSLNLNAPADPCGHLDDYEGRLWLRLEARALAAALRSTGKEQWTAAQDAMLFRAQRNGLDAEDRMERLEGTAEYTGMKLCGLDDKSQREAAAEALDGISSRSGLPRSFAYVTGPALGLLLDHFHPEWRPDVVEGQSLADALCWAIDFGGTEDVDVQARALIYGLKKIESEERVRDQERQARLAELRGRYIDGPVLILQGQEFQVSFDPGRVESLGEHGSVYGTLWVSDVWGVLDARDGALLGGDLRVTLALPEIVDATHLTGPGWALELAPHWGAEATERAGCYRLTEEKR